MTVSLVSCVLSHVSCLLSRVERDVSHVEASLLLRGLHVEVCPRVGPILLVIVVPAAPVLIVPASSLQSPHLGLRTMTPESPGLAARSPRSSLRLPMKGTEL